MTTQQLIDQAFQCGRKNAAYDILYASDLCEVSAASAAREVITDADARLSEIHNRTTEPEPPAS